MKEGNTKWYCVGSTCSHVLGDVFGGELTLARSSKAVTTGPNLKVACGECGTIKIWYTSDQITRAMHQLIDAAATGVARRAIRTLSDELTREKLIEVFRKDN